MIRFEERFDAHFARDHLAGQTLLIDGSDNFATRYTLADAAEKAEVPLVSGAINRFDGSLTPDGQRMCGIVTYHGGQKFAMIAQKRPDRTSTRSEPAGATQR